MRSESTSFGTLRVGVLIAARVPERCPHASYTCRRLLWCAQRGVFEESFVPAPLRPSRRVRRPSADTLLRDRLPPGQIAARRWPVLHQGEVPVFDAATWDLKVFGQVRRPLRLTWDEFQALPQTEMDGDLHCVTRWSKLDNTWRGVELRLLLDRAELTTGAAHLTFHSEGGYTANLALDALDEPILLATHHDGEPLTPEHGFPLRVIAPARYAWKSAKWLRGIEVLAEDEPGFWERYGYHNEADAWREERFAPDDGSDEVRQVGGR